MLGSLVYAGGMQLEEALDVVAIDGAVLGEELDRIGFRGPAPVPGSGAACIRRVPHRTGPGPRARAHRHWCGHRRPGHLVDPLHVLRPVQPCRHHADVIPARRRLCGDAGGDIRARDVVDEVGHPQVGTVGAHRAASEPRQRRRRPGDDDGRRPQHRRRGAAPRRGAHRRLRRQGGRRRGRHGRRRDSGPLRARRVRRPRGRPRRVDCRPSSATARCGCRPAPGTTPRCSPACARQGWSSCRRVDGISHNPAEHTDADDIEAGANVLLHTMLRLADVDLEPAG